MKRLALAIAVLTTLQSARAAAQQVDPTQLVVATAVPDPSGQTLTITGANFGTRPFVTLELIPVTVQYAIDSQILASVPVGAMPPGTYLLTVSRGPTAPENGSLLLTLGNPKATREPAAGGASQVPTLSSPGTDAAATVGDRVITVAEADRQWARTDPAGYLAASRQLYEGRRRAAERMVTDQLLAVEATRRGLTVEALLAEEIPKRTIAMPDAAVTSFYQGLGDRTRGASLDQMRPAIRAWLARNTEPELAKMNYIEELTKTSTRAEVLLAAPRVDVERTARDAALGPASAPVEIVAFGDFESEDYVKFALAFARVREMFGDRLRLVFKHLPVLGPESVAVAEAAACANAQGRFWAYHDAVVTQPGPFGTARLKQIARDVKANRETFDTCVDEGQSRDLIRQALEEAGRYGIQGSPSFLVNGRLAPEAPAFLPPLEFFKRIVEEELQRQAKNASPARR